MFNYLRNIHISNHKILGDIDIDLINPKTQEPYSIVVFVGENGCGKTTLLTELSLLPNHHFVFLRQNSMYVGLANESYKLISGKSELYPIQNKDDLTGGMNVFSLRSNNIANNKEACIELLRSLNDESLIEIYESGKLEHSRCGGEASRIIDGKTDFFDLNTLSSGQQEILLKLKTLQLAQVATDYLLLDEPETSLHPRWQKRIVSLIKEIIKDVNGNAPQMFVATHSEKVLESLIGKEDVLIVRLFKDNNKIQHESISEMDLRLPTPTFAELDYVVFHIDSLDYHDQLFTFFGSLFDKDTSTAIDLKIEKKSIKIYGKNNIDCYKKERTFVKANKIYLTKMLPTYIRDYFHHPNEIIPPTSEELNKSICFLRELIEYMNKSGAAEIEEMDESN